MKMMAQLTATLRGWLLLSARRHPSQQPRPLLICPLPLLLPSLLLSLLGSRLLWLPSTGQRCRQLQLPRETPSPPPSLLLVLLLPLHHQFLQLQLPLMSLQ